MSTGLNMEYNLFFQYTLNIHNYWLRQPVMKIVSSPEFTKSPLTCGDY